MLDFIVFINDTLLLYLNRKLNKDLPAIVYLRYIEYITYILYDNELIRFQMSPMLARNTFLKERGKFYGIKLRENRFLLYFLFIIVRDL